MRSGTHPQHFANMVRSVDTSNVEQVRGPWASRILQQSVNTPKIDPLADQKLKARKVRKEDSIDQNPGQSPTTIGVLPNLAAYWTVVEISGCFEHP